MDNEVTPDQFANILDDLDKNNVLAAKTRKKFYDFDSHNPITDDFFDDKSGQKKTKINNEKSHYAGQFNI